MDENTATDRLNEALGVLDALNENNELPYPDYALLCDLIDVAAAQIAEHDRAVAANAWDEGYNVGGHAASGDYSGIYGGNGQEPPNPYRITEENN